MNSIIFLVPLVFLVFVFFILIRHQSTSVQNPRKSRSEPWQDAGSEPSMLSTNQPQDLQPTSFGSVHEATYVDNSIANYPSDNVGSVDYGYSSDLGGALGSALGDAIGDSGGSSGTFDHSDFGGSGNIDGSSS